MAYRTEHAETEEAKDKERAFTGLGLTSRKNLCLHPEVCVLLHEESAFVLNAAALRFPKKRRA